MEDFWQEEEYAFACPYCGAEISMLLDMSVRRQQYVEDCEVCCQPIDVAYTVDEGFVVDFQAERAQ